MKIIDLYIIKRLFLLFFFMLIATTISIEMIHFVNFMDFFQNASLTNKKILDYYISYSPFMLNFLTPIISFMTTVLVTLILSRNSEVIAMYSIGVRYRRLLYPYLFFAISISCLSFLFCGWIIPQANRSRLIFEINYLNRRSYHNLKNIHVKVDEDKYVYVQNFNAYQGVGENFTLESISNKLKGKLIAEKVNWIPEKKVWRVENWIFRKIDGNKEKLKEGKFLDLVLNLEPSDFGGSVTIKDMVNMNQLQKYIQKLKSKKSDALYLFEAENYVRYMYPFSIILLVLVGIIFASKKIRGGIVWQMILSFILAISYIAMFLFASNKVESHSDNILLTIWMPNIIFSIIIFLVYKLIPN